MLTHPEATQRERDLIKFIPDNDLFMNLISNAKISTPGVCACVCDRVCDLWRAHKKWLKSCPGFKKFIDHKKQKGKQTPQKE